MSLDGVTGLTVPVGDANALAEAMQRLADDRGLRESYGAAARERAERVFSEKVMLGALMREYERAGRKSAD